ncbi:MAG: twin-arginine translocase TatA/TatE family subunit [Planctomycetota bacterium]|jgi:sec-independent protein translocase protein TatA|nr:twin-arginine translocase TatA/TatE family subunit [Planctomycetota bacterium]
MLPNVGYGELLLVAVLAVLIFGKQLPEVAKTIGKGYGKLKKSLTDVQKSIDVQEAMDYESDSPGSAQSFDYDEHDEPTAPKFDPPPSE